MDLFRGTLGLFAYGVDHLDVEVDALLISQRIDLIQVLLPVLALPG